jgi:hypothetical protein
MDIKEALQDVKTIKTVAAGLTRKRDDVYLLMTVTYRIGKKWLKLRVPEPCGTPLQLTKKFALTVARKNMYSAF